MQDLALVVGNIGVYDGLNRIETRAVVYVDERQALVALPTAVEQRPSNVRVSC